MKPSEVGRLLQAQRKRTKKTCPVCGVTFQGLAQQVYYPPKCQQAAAKRRQRAAPKKAVKRSARR